MDEAVSGTRRALWWACVVVVAVWLPIIVFWDGAPFSLTFDDAYYYFEIAKNVAAGHGSTFDTLNPTNGYHPLWLGLAIPVYLVGMDGEAAVRVLLVGQLLVWAGTLGVLVQLVSDAVDGWPRLSAERADSSLARRLCTATLVVALLLFAANPFVLKLFVNGLESGIAAFFEAVVILAVWRRRGRLTTDTSTRWRIGFGVVLALAFLARTDAVILLGCLGLWCLAETRHRGRTGIRPVVEIFAVPAATVIGYLASNVVFFGDPRQVSGEVKRLGLTAGRAGELFVYVLVALGVGVWAHRRSRRPARDPRLPRLSAFAARTGWFASFCILLVGYYAVLSAQQWLWYFAPVALYLLFLLLLAAADFSEGALVEAPAERGALRAVAPVQALLLLPLLAGWIFQLPRFTDPNLRSIQLANRDAGRWISEKLPDDAVLASWDAGVVGYFTDQPVVNVDGVVNSYDFADAVDEGRAGSFLLDERVGYVVNHDDDVESDVVVSIRGLFGPGIEDDPRQVARFPFLYSGSIEGQTPNVRGLREMAVFVHEVEPAGSTP